MEEFIDEKLSTDADYETLNRSLGLIYQGRREFTDLIELNSNETASKTLDIIKVCFNLSNDNIEDDMSTVSPEDFDCALWVTNMIIKLENFSALYDSLHSSGLVRLENLLDGNSAESQTLEGCSRALQNTSQLFDSFRALTDWVTGVQLILYHYSYSNDDAQEEDSDYNFFSDDLIIESLNSVFSLLVEFPEQDYYDVIDGVRDACSFLDAQLNPLKDDAIAAMETINGVRDALARVQPQLRRWTSHVIVHRGVNNHVLPVDHMINEFIEKNLTKLELAKYFASERFSQQREEFVSNTTDIVAILKHYRYPGETAKFKFYEYII